MPAPGRCSSFVRVGTLDEPDRLPPDIHIFTAVEATLGGDSRGHAGGARVLRPRAPSGRPRAWRGAQALLPQIEAYQATRGGDHRAPNRADGHRPRMIGTGDRLPEPATFEECLGGWKRLPRGEDVNLAGRRGHGAHAAGQAQRTEPASAPGARRDASHRTASSRSRSSSVLRTWTARAPGRPRRAVRARSPAAPCARAPARAGACELLGRRREHVSSSPSKACAAFRRRVELPGHHARAAAPRTSVGGAATARRPAGRGASAGSSTRKSRLGHPSAVRSLRPAAASARPAPDRPRRLLLDRRRASRPGARGRTAASPAHRASSQQRRALLHLLEPPRQAHQAERVALRRAGRVIGPLLRARPQRAAVRAPRACAAEASRSSGGRRSSKRQPRSIVSAMARRERPGARARARTRRRSAARDGRPA